MLKDRKIFMLAAAILALSLQGAGADPMAPRHSSCFFSNQFENWKAPDDRTIYIRVGLHRYYRLDLAARCPGLKWPNSHLITRFRGSNTVCTALDWDLKVVEDGTHGIATACIVKAMTELTPAEVAAIPRKFKP